METLLVVTRFQEHPSNQDAIKHPTVHRRDTPPPTKNCSTQNVSRTGVEKPCLREIWGKIKQEKGLT